jgi:Ca2+-binding RTX toxin-like protein
MAGPVPFSPKLTPIWNSFEAQFINARISEGITQTAALAEFRDLRAAVEANPALVTQLNDGADQNRLFGIRYNPLLPAESGKARYHPGANRTIELGPNAIFSSTGGVFDRSSKIDKDVFVYTLGHETSHSRDLHITEEELRLIRADMKAIVSNAVNPVNIDTYVNAYLYSLLAGEVRAVMNGANDAFSLTSLFTKPTNTSFDMFLTPTTGGRVLDSRFTLVGGKFDPTNSAQVFAGVELLRANPGWVNKYVPAALAEACNDNSNAILIVNAATLAPGMSGLSFEAQMKEFVRQQRIPPGPGGSCTVQDSVTGQQAIITVNAGMQQVTFSNASSIVGWTEPSGLFISGYSGVVATVGPGGVPTSMEYVDSGGRQTMDLAGRPELQTALADVIAASSRIPSGDIGEFRSFVGAGVMYRSAGALPASFVVVLPDGISVGKRGEFKDDFGRLLEVTFDATGRVMGTSTTERGVTVTKTFDPARNETSSKIKINAGQLISFADAGSALGQQLGLLVAGDNKIAGVVASATLQTLGGALGKAVDGAIAGKSVTKSIKDALKGLDENFVRNLQSAGIGAVTSFLTAELIRALNVNGVPGELLSTAAGSVINTIITNIVIEGAKTAAEIFNGVGSAATLGNAIGSYIGNKLASQIVTFGSIGGQIGSAVGSILGSLAGAAIGKAVFGSLGTALAGPLGAAIGAFVGTLLGGAIGSLIGGTPRSGADVQWDASRGEFVTANVYSKHGGSKAAARGMATAVAQTFNNIVAVTGGSLMNPELVQTGNYGTRKLDYVYRPTSSRDKETITQRFSGKDAAQRLIGYGLFQGLTDPDFKIAGGNVYVKRALYNTFENGGLDPLNFDASVILGNITFAQRYQSYLENSLWINSLIASEGDSVFAVEMALTLSKAVELGLTRRHKSDWYGGFTRLFTDAESNAANVSLGFDYDIFSGRLARVIEVADLILSDTIDVAGQTSIEGTAGNDTIRLSADALLATSGNVNAGLTVDGARHNDQALEIPVAATVYAGDGDDFVQASDRGDNIFGGDGNDTLHGGRLDDWLIGGSGNDTLDAGAGTAGSLGGDGNYLSGEAGNDTLRGREGSDWLSGGDGTDLLDGGGGDDILAGGGGQGDDLKGGHGDDQYLVRIGDGADEADEVAGAAPVSTLAGGTGDVLRDRAKLLIAEIWRRNWAGTNEEAEAVGTASVATVSAGGEDAIVFGPGIGMGDIKLVRSQTAEEAAAKALVDSGATVGDATRTLAKRTTGPHLVVKVTATQIGANGTISEFETGTQITVKDWFVNTLKRVEWLKFADGNEVRIGDIENFIIGTSGNDIINGTAGNDFAWGGEGNDHIRLGDGNDIGNGGSGDDAVWGDGDRDLVIGGIGRDKLYGGASDDVLSGDAGDDDLSGDEGHDILSGGRGNDRLAGGAGRDTIKFARGDGRDTIVAEQPTAVAPDATADDWSYVWKYGDGAFDKSLLNMEGHFQWFDGADGRELKYYVGQPVEVYSASDAIEFGLDIDIQDIALTRLGTDLVLVIGSENAEDTSLASARDTITISNWYAASGDPAVPRPVDRIAFYNTGILDLEKGNWTLIAGTDAADGTPAAAFAGTGGSDWITGGGGDDVIDGLGGDDILNGNGGDDDIRGGEGSDVLYGGAGDDVLAGGGGLEDVLVGGIGLDTASYAGSAARVSASLDSSSANSGDARGDRYFGIENLTGSGHADHLTGDEGNNILEGGKGSDTLQALAGDDTYVWNLGDGTDSIEEGAFVFEEAMSAGGTLAAGFTPHAWSDTTDYDDRVVQTDHFEIWRGSERVYHYKTTVRNHGIDDTDPRTWPSDGWERDWYPTGNGLQAVRRTPGADAPAGDDTLEMGPGISLADLGFERSGDNLVIRHGGSDTQKVTIINHFAAGQGGRVEWLQFADGQAVSLVDVLAATAAAPNVADDGDELADELLAGDGATNSLSGGGGNDALSGGGGGDTLHGGEGNDILEGGSGADTLDGGGHNSAAADPARWGDTARYATSAESVRIALNGSAVSYGSGGHADGDAISNVEHVLGSNATGATAWGNAGDHLTGDAGDNRLFGLAGNDYLSGGGGGDVLGGGDGSDELHGGAGDDGLDGGEGDDYLYGTSGRDILAGGGGNDRLEAGAPTSGAAGSSLDGGSGDDDLYGSIGDDVLSGGDGADDLYGGAGNDTLSGGGGDDLVLQGGAGNDIYVFGAHSGRDEITDASGIDRIVFEDVATEQIWLTRTGDNLRIRVIGGNSDVTVIGYFANGSPSLMRDIAAGEKTILLKLASGPDYPTSLVATMSNTEMPASVEAVPAALAARRDALWVEGDQAAPIVSDQAHPIDERQPGSDAALAGQVGAVDHDGDIAGPSSYSIATGPQLGVLTLSPTTAGAWTYTPHVYANGTDSFRLRVVDAAGNAAEQTVTVNIAAVNSKPVFGAVPASLSILEDAAADTVLATLSVSDPDGTTPTLTIAEANSPFQISQAGVISVKPGATFDSQTNPTVYVTVQASDGATGVVSQPLAVTVINVNDAPNQPQVAGTPIRIISEGTLGGTVIANFTLTDPDAGDPLRVALRSGPAAVFSAADSSLSFTAGIGNFEDAAAIPGAVLVDRDNDGQREAEFTAFVEARDHRTSSVDATQVVVGIEDVNEAPTSITLTGPATAVERDRPQSGLPPQAAISLGTLTAADPDVYHPETFSFTPNDSRFEVVNGNELRLKATAALDYETAAVDGANRRYLDVSITVRDHGGTGLPYTQNVRVFITDLVDYFYGTAAGETLSGATGRDALYGRDGNDTLHGLAGDDDLYGEGGADTLLGGDGNDTLDGGLGADRLEGGLGNDVYVVDDGLDQVVEQAGQGTDEVRTALADHLLADNVDNLTGTAATGQILRGNAGNNVITGGAGNDTIRLEKGGLDKAAGGDGSDTAYFGGTYGAGDEFDGGAGSDTALFQGNTAITAATMRLFNVESISLLAGSNTFWGESGSGRYSYSFVTTDATVGLGLQLKVNGSSLLAGENLTFNGSAELDGSFYIYGGSGIDTLTGGAGNDVFYFDKDGRFAAGDTVVGGAGTGDELILRGAYSLSFGAGSFKEVEKLTLLNGSGWGTQFSYTLATHQDNVALGQTLTLNASSLRTDETLTFSGAAETDGSFHITGGAGIDVITGGGLADTIIGGAGNDSLTGGGGIDRLEGGLGDDVYVVETAGDVVVELSGQGNDEVKTSLTEYTLADNVEKLTGTLAGTQSLTGNASDNVVTGNIARDWFYMQQGGNDHVIGNAGSDLFFFGATLDSGDRVDGGADTDAVFVQGNLTINTATLTFISIDQITVLSGTDARYGENGLNLYNYSITAADATFSGGGRVAISAGGLVAGENITFNGAAETDVWYYFVAGQGGDNFTGGAGNDVFYFDKDGRWNTGDVVVGGAGTDEIIMRGAYNVAFGAGSFSGIEKLTISTGSAWATQFSYNISIHQSNVALGETLTVNASSLLAGEKLVFSGSAETDGFLHITGGVDGDTLTGGGLADTIIGGGGNDKLTGGAGADLLEGGLGDDIYVVDDLTDNVVEQSGQGTDEVQTSLADYTLAANVEKLTGTAATTQTLRGNALDNVVTGNVARDWFYMQSGGNDHVIGNAGSDIFIFGNTLGAGDRVEGGADTDVVMVQGNLTFNTGAATLIDVEQITLLSGTEARYGESGTNSYNYSITSADSTFANGVRAVVHAGSLVVGETFTFNGSAETDAWYYLIAGFGTDTMTGGAKDDVFYFDKDARYATGDTVVGGAGTDEIVMRGAYSVAFGASTMTGVEKLTISTGSAYATQFSYNITMHDANVGIGQVLIVSASTLLAGETLTFTGSAETNGYLIITGGADGDTLVGGSLADTIAGGAGGDTLRGGAGNDRIEGGDGKDVLEGGAGVDQLVGGNDSDTVSYAGSAAVAATLSEWVGAISEGTYTKAATSVAYTGVRVDLVANSSADAVYFTGAVGAIGGDAAGDRFSGIENLTGSDHNDRLRGTAAASEVRGGKGNDVIYGGEGDDKLYGDDGDDVIYGQAGIDTIEGGEGKDRLFGEGLGDILDGGIGNDDLIGGAGEDSYRFKVGFGDDTVYNYDGDGSPDVMQFIDIAHTDLWFSKSGKDLVVKQLGTLNQVTVKGYFLNDTAGNWEDNGDFVMNFIIAGVAASSHKVNTPALLALMKQFGQPASFGSLTTAQQNDIKSAWGVNTKPTVTAFASNPVSTGEGNFVDLKFTISDGQSPATSLKLAHSVTSGIFEPIQTSDWTIDPVDNRIRTLRLRPVQYAHGLATLTLSANDWVFDSDTYTTQVRLLARADPVSITAALTKSTNVGTTVLLPGTLDGGKLALINDTNSEIFNHVKVEAVPVGATLSDGAGNSFTSTAGATTATITGWNLAGLRVTPAAGSTTDFTMVLKAASKENLQPHEILPGQQVGPEASTTIKVIVNAAPTSVGLRGTGLAPTPSVDEFTPTTNPSGKVVGVAVASDPDSIEANRVSTDFNLLPKAGGGEERIITAAGPTGAQVQVLETGQFAGMGGDAGHAGGGVYGASAGAPDTTRAYKYTIYVKPENLITHYLYLGAIGQVENATTGAADGNPYFYYGLSTSLTQNRWYRIEGWVLPANHAPVAGDVFGGVFDTVTGAKVANTTTFRFAQGATDTGVRFFSYYGQEATGYSAQWYQPQVEKLDFDYALIDNAGGRFAINGVTGLVTATGTNFDYETATAHNVTVRATDSSGLFKDQVIAVGVNNINEKPNAISLQSQTLWSEYVASPNTAHPGQTIAAFNMSDPDGTTPTLKITSAQTYPWFKTSGNQLLFDQANFSSTWLRSSLGAHGQDAGYYYDTDGDGLKEIRVATLTLAAVDSGNLQSDPFTYNVYIEDRNEAPVFATQTLALAENPASYQLVGTVAGSDVDDPASDLRYLFNGAASYYDAALGRTVSASPDAKFVVDYVDGRVWTKGAQALNFEGPNAFSYTMQVIDRANGTHKLSSTGTLNINLTNVNEAPGPMTLTSQTLHSETVPGDTPHYSAGAIAAFGLSDPDGTTPSISIIGGNGNGWFGTSGNQLIFSTANFSAGWLRSYAGQYGTDAAWSYDTDNDGLKEIRVATLTLAATDSGGLQGSPYTYNVFIEDKNEAPAFGTTQYNFAINENAASYQYVGAVSASDVDGPAGELRYTFAGRQWYVDGTLGRWVTSSADGRFLMDFHDGRVWKTAAALDYESTPALNYQISVYDRALGNNTKWSNGTLNVTVQNLNDNAPAMPTVDQWGTTAFNENSGSGMAIAYLSVPYDADGSGGLSYQITSNPDNLFEISGWAIRMKADRTPNFETFASSGASTTIQVRFRVTDGTHASAENAINLTIYNVNEGPPVMTQVPGTFTVAENTGWNTIVSDGFRAADPEGAAVTYSIDQSTNPNGAFGVNAYGQIVIAGGVDYEAGGWLSDAYGKYANLSVIASDGGAATSATVQIRIANQVLTVQSPNGTMNGRYRAEWTSTYLGGEYGYDEHRYNYEQPTMYNSGWYSEVRYIDNVTGAVVLHDGDYGPYQNQPNRVLPHPAYASLAQGFRWTGNGQELVSDDEHNSWSLGPIVFDLVGAGLDNAFGASKVAFDIQGDGTREQVGWLNSGFAFLALDRDGDGRIGSGLEISFTQDKAGARTDLEGLAAFDSNGDGLVSAADLRFGEFLLWEDANADGASQAGELRTLTQAGIASISLAATATGRTFANTDGNVILNSAGFAFADGRTGAIGDAVLRATLADTAAAAADAVAFAARGFAGKAKRYRLTADGGSLTIVPAEAKGALDPRDGRIGPATMLSFRNKQIGMLAPIVLDLDGDGVELKSIGKAKAWFDMNGDGSRDDTGWIGKGDGLLVIDRDGDGRISGPSELSLLPEKPGATSDLDALGALDSNRDGKIDASDARFGDLKVWVDRDGDGTTDAGELGTLGDHGIASIGLSASAGRETAKIGDNIVLSTGLFTRSDGTTGTFADAALAFKPGRGQRANDVLDEALERRLEAIRSGIGGPLRLESLDFGGDRFPTLPDVPGAIGRGDSPDLPLIAHGAAMTALAGTGDARTALMTQHMAAFGARTGEAEWQLRERPGTTHFDYFAQ